MRKFVTYAVVIATIVWSLGLAAVVPASAAYAPTAGDLVKTATDSAVYYIDADGNRNLFVNAVTFWSWYSGDWSNIAFGSETKSVTTITQEDFDSLTVGDHVGVRAGTRLIKFQNSPRVYAVTPGAELVTVVNSDGDEAVKDALYGADYPVVTIQNGFENDYTKTGTVLSASSSLPNGSLIKYEGSEDIYYVEDGMKRIIEDDAFLANALMDSAVVTVATSMTYSEGTSITEAEAGLTTIAGSTSAGSGVAGAASVRLSSMTPSATTYLSSQAKAVFLIIEVANTGSTDVTIDTFKIERSGLAVNADFSSIAAYEDSVLGTQIGLNKTLNSDNRVTFGDDVTVAAGTTKKIVVAGNMAATGTLSTGNAPKLGLYSMGLKSGSTLSGLDSTIWGNTMNLSSAVAIATATIVAGGSDPSTNTAPKIGDTDVNLAQIKITNDSSTEEIQVEKVTFKQAGTVADSDIEMYELVDSSDNSVLATASQVDKYIEFVFATALNIGKSKNVSLMARAVEINDGSSRTIDLDIYRNTDVVVKGLQYNAYVIPTFTGVSSQPYFNGSSSAAHQIGNGTVKIESSNDFSASNIAEGKTVQIAEWLFTVKGEGVDVEQISARIATSTSGNTTVADITNGIFFDVDTGDALTGATDAGANATGAPGITSTDTISLGVGIHKIGLKVDLSSDFSNNDTIRAGITAGNMTVTGQVTGNSITPTPSAEGLSSIQTIKTAKLTISNSIRPAAQNVIRGDNVVASNIYLDASASGDDLMMTQLKTDLYTTSMSPDEITSITIWDGSSELTTSNNPLPTSATAADSVTTTWSFASALTIPAGTVKVLTIKVTTAGFTSANDKFAVGSVSTTTAGANVKDTEGEDVTPTYNQSRGQLMTIQTTGTLTLTRSDELSSGMLAGNTDGIVLGEFTASAINGAVDIEKMYVGMAAVNSGGTDELEALYLYDGGTLIATAYVTSSSANQNPVLFNMETNPLPVAVNTTKTLTIKGDTAIIDNLSSSSTGTANSGFTPSIASGAVTAKTNGAAATITSATLTFPSYRILKSVPTVTLSSTGSVASDPDADLIDVTIGADAKGPIGLYKLTFKVSTTTVTAAGYTVYEGNTLVATESSTAEQGINRDKYDGYDTLEVYFNLGGTIGGRLREIGAGSSKTYTLKATVTGYTTSGNVSVSLLGDDTVATYARASAVEAEDDDDFIWSDLSYSNTSTTATQTPQWLNGFEIDSSGGFVGTTSSARSI